MTLQIELVAADRVVWSGEATEVIARTAEGDMGVLTGHAPLLSLLAPGIVRIHPVDGDTVGAAVSEGFISVAADRVSIIAEEITLGDEIDEAATFAELEEARDADDVLAIRRAEAKLRFIGKAS